MDFTTYLIIIAALYGMLFFFDMVFKVFMLIILFLFFKLLIVTDVCALPLRPIFEKHGI